MIRVVATDGQPIEAPPVQAHPDVIAHLERLLDRARAGQINVLAFVAWGPHNSDAGYAGVDELGDGVYLMGMLTRVQLLLAERVETLSAPVVEYPKP